MLLLSLVSMPHPAYGNYSPRSSVAFASDCRILISEFYPNAPCQDEYFRISCTGDSYFCMRNWSISDGEGEIRIVSDLWLVPGKAFTVSFNSSSYWNAFGSLPDLSLDLPFSSALVQKTGSFRLADSGDEIVLRGSGGALFDSVRYGSSDDGLAGWSGAAIPSLRKGEVAKRLEANCRLVDSDTALDWQPFREYRYGYTEYVPTSFSVSPGAITAFASPDCSLDVVLAAIDDANRSICASTYELSSVPVCEGLLRALDRGVRVRLLVDGAPAGGMTDDEVSCLSVLASHGARVFLVNGNLSKGIVQHVGALHAKYMVIDSSNAIVMSENLVEDGLPQDRVFGNRGWGVFVRDENLSAYLESLFESDSRRYRPDVLEWTSDPRFSAIAALPHATSMHQTRALLEPLASSRCAFVTAIVSPDASVRHPYLLDHIQAGRSVMIEQFQADLIWNDRWTGQTYVNPIVQSLLGSANAGVDVRLLLDSSWFNIERNSRVIECLRGNCTVMSAVSFEMIDERSPISILHNKGAIVDRAACAITSNNWVSASFAKNRELALIVESEEIASYFERSFEYDWVVDDTPPSCVAGDDIKIEIGGRVLLDAGRCTEDRLIVNYSWDFDVDGRFDSFDIKTLYEGKVEGMHVIVLRVVDSWGNSATDEIRVTVEPVTAPAAEGKANDVLRMFWPVPLSIAVGAVAAALIRGRKTKPVSRKLNHRPRS